MAALLPSRSVSCTPVDARPVQLKMPARLRFARGAHQRAPAFSESGPDPSGGRVLCIISPGSAGALSAAPVGRMRSCRAGPCPGQTAAHAPRTWPPGGSGLAMRRPRRSRGRAAVSCQARLPVLRALLIVGEQHARHRPDRRIVALLLHKKEISFCRG